MASGSGESEGPQNLATPKEPVGASESSHSPAQPATPAASADGDAGSADARNSANEISAGRKNSTASKEPVGASESSHSPAQPATPAASAASDPDCAPAQDSASDRDPASGAAPANVPCGIKWTCRDVFRGKSHVALSICFVVVGVLTLLCLVISIATDQFSIKISEVLQGSISLKPDQVGEMVGVSIVIFFPVVAIVYLISVFVLKFVYRSRDRHVPRTPENLEAHRIEASGSWRWQFSVLIGSIDFVAMYGIFQLIRWLFSTCTARELPAVTTTLATLVMLVLAERRVRNVSERTAAYLKSNGLAIRQTLAGKRDGELPEKLRNDLGRSSVALVLSLGVVGSEKWAARLVQGVGLRTRVKLYSGFLCSFIHGILTALTFGIASTVAHELGRVPDAFAKGKQAELNAKLLQKAPTRPKLYLEVIALLICVVYVTIQLLIGLAPTLGF